MSRVAAQEPQIIYVHHQSSPFPTRIWRRRSPSQSRRVPALMSRTVNMIGMRSRAASKSAARSVRRIWGPASTRGIRYVDYIPMLQNINSF